MSIEEWPVMFREINVGIEYQKGRGGFLIDGLRDVVETMNCGVAHSPRETADCCLERTYVIKLHSSHPSFSAPIFTPNQHNHAPKMPPTSPYGDLVRNLRPYP
jgi:hypothetical protein